MSSTKHAVRYRSRILDSQCVRSRRPASPASAPPPRRGGSLRSALVASTLLLLCAGLGLLASGRPAQAMTPGRSGSFRALLPAYENPNFLRASTFVPPPAPEPATEPVAEAAATIAAGAAEPIDPDAVAWPDRSAPPLPHDAPGWIDAGLKHLGARYVWGGERPEAGFDCSGFVRHALAEAGVSMPRTAREQYAATVAIDRGQLAPGDLVFFSTYAPGASHVGIYLGEGRFLHASSAARRITINDLDDYKKKFIGARRVSTT